MNDEDTKVQASQQDDIDADTQTTSQNDEENTDIKYAKSLYSDNEKRDYLDEEDLNSEDVALDSGLGDDAYQTYDSDDATLPADNDEDVTETGVDIEDGDNLNPAMEKMGDTVIDLNAGDIDLDDEVLTTNEDMD